MVMEEEEGVGVYKHEKDEKWIAETEAWKHIWHGVIYRRLYLNVHVTPIRETTGYRVYDSYFLL